MSEYDVYRRQILTTKVDPRAVRVKCRNLSTAKQNKMRDKESKCHRIWPSRPAG